MQMQEGCLIIAGMLMSLALICFSWRCWNTNVLISQTMPIWCLVIGCVINGAATVLQYSTDHYQRLTYNQFYNGVETSTEERKTVCTRDGLCLHTYSCDPYTVTIHHASYDTTSGSGTQKKTIHHPGYDTTETRYRACPYEQWESTWLIHTTVGDFTVAFHWFPDHPAFHEWREGHSYPTGVGSGMPQEILLAQRRINSGDPRPATSIQTYTNYIYASDNILLKVPDSQREKYRTQGLLPSLATGVIGVDQAHKAFFAGFSPNNREAWEDALMRINMEAGSLLPVTTRFDIQFVAVDAKRVPETSADEYTTALNAYWEAPSFFQKSVLPKNTAVVVVGTDGQTVSWARGFTLIRQGNGITWRELAAFLPGTPFMPQDLVGVPHGSLSIGRDGTMRVLVVPAHGNLESILIYGSHPFVRPHMTDHHPGTVGFNYLEGEILPDFWSCVRFFVIALLLTMIFVNVVFWRISRKTY